MVCKGRRTALLAIVLVSAIFRQQWNIDDFADVQLPRSSGDSYWIAVRARAYVWQVSIGCESLSGRGVTCLQRDSFDHRNCELFQVRAGYCLGTRRT